MNQRTRAIDWQAIHTRLERARQVMESEEGRSPAETARILRSRSEALAKPLEHAAPSTEKLELLVFALAKERFGIETCHALEAILMRELVHVPCTPAFIQGVINHRGQILTVLDLRPMFGLPGAGIPEGSKVIAVQIGSATFGILADTILGTFAIPTHTVTPPTEAFTGLRLTLIRGVTDEFIRVLDLDALVRTPEVLVSEEMG